MASVTGHEAPTDLWRGFGAAARQADPEWQRRWPSRSCAASVKRLLGSVRQALAGFSSWVGPSMPVPQERSTCWASGRFESGHCCPRREPTPAANPGGYWNGTPPSRSFYMCPRCLCKGHVLPLQPVEVSPCALLQEPVRQARLAVLLLMLAPAQTLVWQQASPLLQLRLCYPIPAGPPPTSASRWPGSSTASTSHRRRAAKLDSCSASRCRAAG